MKNYKATIVFRSGAVRELYLTGKSKEDIGMNIFNRECEMARGVIGTRHIADVEEFGRIKIREERF